MSKIVIDLDGTLTIDTPGPYSDKKVNEKVLNALRCYQAEGYSIVIYTARNMRTYEGNVGKINVYTVPSIVEWLKNNGVPFDELIVGKPWCGHDGFYVDDRAIRPSEFYSRSKMEITELLAQEKDFLQRENS